MNWLKSVKTNLVVFFILPVFAAGMVAHTTEYDQLLPKGETAEETALRQAGLWPPAESGLIEHDGILPKGETEEEKRMRELGLWPVPQRWEEAAPLFDPVSMAEHWPMAGILIRFTGSEYLSTYEGLIREAQEVGLVWIWLSNTSQQTTVTNRINNWGIPMTNIRFLVSSSDSIWMRDYAPLWVFNDQGDPEIINFNYDRPRPNDNNFPVWLGGHWGIPVYTTNLLYEGGNFIADGCGTCFATNRLYEQNSTQYTPAQVDQIMRDYFGCEQLIILTKMIGDGTGHIDMFCKLLDENTFIVNQVASGNTNYTILENNASFLQTLTAPNGEPYNVVRMPMGNNFRTYTNSLIVNNKVIVPTYNIALDSTALAMYESLMPGYDVVGVDSSSIIGANGAIHCITMGVPLPCPIAPVTDYVELYSSGPGEVTLEWQDVPLAEGFRIYRSETGCDEENMILIGESWTTAFVDDTVNDELTYYYRVSSFTYCRESSKSDCVFTETECLNHGDVDFNGILTAGDAQMIFQIALGMYSPTWQETCAADCNGDGVVTAADSQIVFLASLGMGDGCADSTTFR